MKAVILDADSLGEGVDLTPLRARVDQLEVWPSTAPEQVGHRLQAADIALTNKVVLDATTIETLPRLKLICVMATGTNNIDTESAVRHGIAVRNVAAYGTESVAQHVMMMMLSLAVRLPLYQQDVKQGQWQQAPFFCLMHHPVMQLSCRHLVLVGQGELGNRVAELAKAFNMKVSFAARPGNEKNDKRPSLAELAPQADVLSLHCPLTPQTTHLVDKHVLGQLKDHTLLINCARGGIIDEVAALEALEAGRLGGLGVDVLPEEPPCHGHPLLEASGRENLNLIVTPHNAWITLQARQRIIELSADNIDEFAVGMKLQ
ncbi:D-2-hydroxyacid dehydrogenase [Kushneria phosphatilytica]|uniref:D-2-hydroxyacid dehydrogenase n=1 Tax=Kushneria phosphatilytica TaxID=657387 RepID=A0A1S1P0F0_9GAMM|nr:D-2-hydroxyacid dehydrogenase [Kushneria phosphatilytica]OHV11955.1 glycerate dehydrogenase [Kushneria phosphatilytica]QEL11138.1 D-2-hydroxyacid dehydrogenase [Kushneria phosphatilytica]